jgi:hypothetical protein
MGNKDSRGREAKKPKKKIPKLPPQRREGGTQVVANIVPKPPETR